jgi:hypothetical protein
MTKSILFGALIGGGAAAITYITLNDAIEDRTGTKVGVTAAMGTLGYLAAYYGSKRTLADIAADQATGLALAALDRL